MPLPNCKKRGFLGLSPKPILVIIAVIAIAIGILLYTDIFIETDVEKRLRRSTVLHKEMSLIWRAIREYVEKYDEVPHDDRGIVTLDILFDAPPGTCLPLRPGVFIRDARISGSASILVINPRLQRSDVLNAHDRPAIFVATTPGSLIASAPESIMIPDARDQREVVYLLLNRGPGPMRIRVDSTDYEAWFGNFASPNQDPNRIYHEDGSLLLDFSPIYRRTKK